MAILAWYGTFFFLKTKCITNINKIVRKVIIIKKTLNSFLLITIIEKINLAIKF